MIVSNNCGVTPDPEEENPMRLSRRFLILATAALLAVGLGIVVVVGLAGGFDKVTTRRLAGGGTKVVHVALVDATLGLDVTPDIITVDPGTHLVLDVVNESDEVHDLALEGGSPRTRRLDRGESQRLNLGPLDKNVEMWCTLPDHKVAGMTIQIRVAATSPTGAAAA